MAPRSRRRWGAAIATAAAALGFLAPCLASTVTAAATVTVDLPAPAEVGQVASTTLAVDSTIAGAPSDGTLSVRAGMSREVAAVDGSGSYTTRSTIESLDVAQVPVGFDAGALDQLDGVAVIQTFSSTGAVTAPGHLEGADGSVDTASSQLVDWIASTSLAYPEGPVAIGQSWTSPGVAPGLDGESIPVTYQCRLAAVDGRQFTIEVSFAQGFSGTSTSAGAVQGTVSGRGTLIGSLDNPLVLSGRVDQLLDAIGNANGAASEVTVTSAITMQSTG